jgi:hypothetical protein
MTTLLLILLSIAVLGCCLLAFLLVRERFMFDRRSEEAAEQLEAASTRAVALTSDVAKLRAELQRVQPWTRVADAAAAAASMETEAARIRLQARADVDELKRSADEQRNKIVTLAESEAKRIVDAATLRAQEMAGEALEAVRNLRRHEQAASAIRHRIEGYGSRYLVPSSSVLDGLAEEFGHADAGRALKSARERTRSLLKADRAATCDYSEAGRREAAMRFVVDAFNGKVDSILARVRHDNVGTLRKEIEDACALVNWNGAAFRNAAITEEYLAARSDELRWACAVHELRRRSMEEQRAIRERIRDEEKARRDYERTLRESVKEEEMLRRALAKAEAHVATATSEQRARYEAQIAELGGRLAEAEERGRRALSMAEQTKRGYVYVVSNVGSFGDGVYKIGLTRRLDPMDRIWELSDASVPFDFDVHAMIMAEDAPALERKLHRHFLLQQVNKVNHRKEFFRASIAELRAELESIGIEVQWTMTAEAREYLETKAIERRMEEDPSAKEAWLRRQRELDPVDGRALLTAGAASDGDESSEEPD